MTKNIDFYFDFTSPYTYIGHKRIELEGSKFNFKYKPILLGGLHKLWNITPQAFIEPKKQFMISDCEMVSKKLKIDFKFNSKFPLSSVKLMRGCLILNEEQYVDASLVAPTLDYLKRWPLELWQLAFIEDLHLLPQTDFRFIEGEINRSNSI